MSAALKSVSDVRHEREAIEFRIDDFLRRAGWKQTSSTVGCFWMWQREIDGRVFLVEKSMALAIQGNLDLAQSDDEDGES